MFKPFRTAIAAVLIVAAPSAQSVMYRWVNQDGSVMYSDQPPSNPTTVRQLTVIDGPVPMTSHEKRTLEILEAERSGLSADIQSGRDAQAFPGGRTGREPESGSRDLFGRGEPGTEPQAPRVYVRPSQPEAAQDPCLRSSDPRCYEKNRSAYVPGLGYSPSAVRARPDFPAGAGGTSGMGAGGILGRTAASAPTPAYPTPSFQPRQSLKDAKDLK